MWESGTRDRSAVRSWSTTLRSLGWGACNRSPLAKTIVRLAGGSGELDGKHRHSRGLESPAVALRCDRHGLGSLEVARDAGGAGTAASNGEERAGGLHHAGALDPHLVDLPDTGVGQALHAENRSAAVVLRHGEAGAARR